MPYHTRDGHGFTPIYKNRFYSTLEMGFIPYSWLVHTREDAGFANQWSLTPSDFYKWLIFSLRHVIGSDNPLSAGAYGTSEKDEGTE